MAAQMSQTNIRQNNYETVYGRNFSYAIGGSTMDYAYAKVGVPLCYTLGTVPLECASMRQPHQDWTLPSSA